MIRTHKNDAPSFSEGAFCFLLVMALLTLPASARSDTVSIGAGPGYYRFSHDSAVVLVRYERDAKPLFNQGGFWAGTFAAWNGENRAEAVGVSRGLRWPFGDAWHADAEFGLNWISDTTDNLGTPLEFLFRLAAGTRVGAYDFSLGVLHYSNAKWLFGWDGPNNGENFVVLSVGWTFH